MITVSHLEGHLYALRDSRFSPALRDAGRAIPGMRWDAAAHAWLGYADAVEACAHELKTAHGIEVRGDIPRAEDGLLGLETPGILAPADLHRSYSNEGVLFLASRGSSGALLCFDLGLGKSAVSLTAARAFREPTLVVCPSNVRGVWIGSDIQTSEVKKWWPDAYSGMRVLEGVTGGAWYVHSLADEEHARKTHGGTWLQAKPTRAYDEAQAITGKTKRAAAIRACKQRFQACAWSPVPDFAFPTRADAETCVHAMWPAETKRGLEKLIEYIPAALYDTDPNAPEDARPPLVTVCHYDILYAWAPHLAGVVRTFILDEGHYASNPEARRTRAAMLVSASAARRYALTGTPMTNRPENLFGLLETISPSRFSRPPENNPWDFYRRYCNLRQETVGADPKTQKTVWKHDGVTNADELAARLRHIMFRRTKRDPDVKLALPKLTRQVVSLDVPKKFCMSAAATLASASKRLDASGTGADKFNDGAVRRALELSADGALPEIVNMTEDAITGSPDARVVVFCHRRVVAEHIAMSLAERGIDAKWVHGELARAAREKIIGTHPQVLVATIEVAGIGIDLSYASIGIFAELSWEWHKLAQAEGRLHRFGQVDPVLIRYCIPRGSVAELVWAGVRKKLEAAEKIIGKDAGGLRETVETSAEEEEKASMDRLFRALKKRSEAEANETDDEDAA